MKTARGVVDILIEAGVFRKDGHFVFSSGRHAGEYIDKNRMYLDAHKISRLCRLFASRFVEHGVEVVIGAATGGIVLSQWTAYHIAEMSGKRVESVYADKMYVPGSLAWYLFGFGRSPREELVIRRGYGDAIRNRRVLIVEDIGVTGGTVRRLVKTAREYDAEVVGVAMLCNRGKLTAAGVGDVPLLYSLFDLSTETWTQDECPFCRENVPINTEYGHGAEFLARKRREWALRWWRRMFGSRCR